MGIQHRLFLTTTVLSPSDAMQENSEKLTDGF